MSVTQTGVAVFWGLGSSFAAAGTGIGGTGAVLLYQSVDFDVEAAKTVEIENYQGETVGKVFANQKQNLKIDVIPSADTIAHAKSGSILPTPGSVVTITDTDDTEVSATNSGKYLFVKGSKKRTKDAPVMLTFELEQWVANDVTAAVT